MNIQAIGSISSTVSAQPIKPVSFKREDAPREFLRSQTFGEEHDTFVNNSDPEIMSQKYDIACRLAAYYKNKYESLAQNGNCIA